MTQKELEQLFSQYGRIITSRILVDQVTGKWAVVLDSLVLPDGQIVKYSVFSHSSLASRTHQRYMWARKCNFLLELFINMHGQK